MVLLAQFLQDLLQIQCLIIQSFDIVELNLLFEIEVPPLKNVWFVFQIMHHTIVLHQYWFRVCMIF
jgi:hypothetical protein